MAERSQIMSIKQLLDSEDLYPPTDCLFIERENLSIESRCLIDPADLYDVDYVPPLAVENNLKYTIMMDTYFDIMHNIECQILKPSVEQKFEALIFYIKNDAFIVL